MLKRQTQPRPQPMLRAGIFTEKRQAGSAPTPPFFYSCSSPFSADFIPPSDCSCRDKIYRSYSSCVMFLTLDFFFLGMGFLLSEKFSISMPLTPDFYSVRFHSKIQRNPPRPSLTTREMARVIFLRIFSGMPPLFFCNPSSTNSRKVLPKNSVDQSFSSSVR